MGTIAVLSPTELTVEPGSQASATIRVRNTGSIVDRFDVAVVGAAAAWTRVEPASLSLFPGVEGVSTITFAPPRASLPRAGTIPFGVRVRPETDPSGSTVEEGRVAVGPFTSAVAQIVPQTSRGSRVGRHEVLVDNRGNAPVTVAVSASDPDRLLGFEVAPERAIVGPEERAAFHVTARAGETFPMGPNRSFPFVVTVEPVRQEPIQLRGTLNQRPILPGWLPPVGGIALAGIALSVVAFAAGLGPFAPAATPEPTDVAQVSPPPTETPTASASEVPTETASEAPTESASGGPTPTPPPLRPRDFTLTVTGDEVELGGGLELACEASDNACRREVKEIVIAMLTELQNPYTGMGIVSTRTLTTPNTLPLVMAAEREFPWRQAGAGETGVTTTAVVDLGPLLASPPAYPYVVVTTPDGLPHRFVVDSGLARQLFDRIYRLPDEMPPVVAATPAPGLSIADPIFAQPIWDVSWVLLQPLATPTP